MHPWYIKYSNYGCAKFSVRWHFVSSLNRALDYIMISLKLQCSLRWDSLDLLCGIA